MEERIKTNFEKILTRAIADAQKNEIMISIDPRTFVGKEVLWGNEKIHELEKRIDTLTSSINLLRVDLSKQSEFKRLLRKIFFN